MRLSEAVLAQPRIVINVTGARGPDGAKGDPGSPGEGYATRAAIAAIVAPTNFDDAYLTEIGREGRFIFDDSDLSAAVTADPLQGIYLPPASDVTGASGAWVRERGEINPFWFMTPAQVADVIARTGGQNVTAALRSAAALVEFFGSGVIRFEPGLYVVGAQINPGLDTDGVTPIAFQAEQILKIYGCSEVRLIGYGACLKMADGLKFGAFDPVTGDPYASVSPFMDYTYQSNPGQIIDVRNNGRVAIEGLELDGNLAELEIGGKWGDTGYQIGAHGIWASDNDSLTVRNVYAHHNGTDGLVVRQSIDDENENPRPVYLENVTSLFNGRQGFSLTGGKQVTVINCDFSHTGRTINTGTGVALVSMPASGVDIEAEGALIRDVLFDNCRFAGNFNCGVIAASGYSDRVQFRNCFIETMVLGKFGVRCEDCLIVGYTNFVTATTNEYLADAPTTAADGHRFTRCRFSYDEALSSGYDTGTTDLTTQSLWFSPWGVWDECVIDTGDVLLPDAYVPFLPDHAMIFRNCRFNSAGITGSFNEVVGRFQGVNRFTVADTLTLALGPSSIIEYGKIFVNDVEQVEAGGAVDRGITIVNDANTNTSPAGAENGYYVVKSGGGAGYNAAANSAASVTGDSLAYIEHIAGDYRAGLAVDSTGQSFSNFIGIWYENGSLYVTEYGGQVGSVRTFRKHAWVEYTAADDTIRVYTHTEEDFDAATLIETFPARGVGSTWKFDSSLYTVDAALRAHFDASP